MHALIVDRGDARWTPEGHQVHGFRMSEGALRDAFGMTIEMVPTEGLAEVERAITDRPADVAFVMISFREDPEEVVGLFRRLAEGRRRPKLIFLDYFAPSSSPFFEVLPFVDCYCKRQMYRDPSAYLGEYAGGNLLTDYVSGTMGIGLDGWNFSSVPDPDQLDKLVHGWNLGVTPRYHQLLKLTAALPIPWEWRPFAVNRRLELIKGSRTREEWYHRYRRRWADAIAPLGRDFLCTASNRVRFRRYVGELMLSKIGVSPFGWGEVCFRDFEVIASGALLIKPSMAHLKTSPDIYVEHETYVPCSWDGSDVEEICRHYLAHPGEAKAIVREGRRVLSRYFEQDGFVADVGRILSAVGLGGPVP